MDAQNLEQYKKRLGKERAELVAKIDGEKPENFGSDVDEDEEADEAESFGAQLAVNQGFRERVGEIDVALNKIREGKYGICENCGKKVEEKILDLSPESRLCQNCKKNS